MRFTRLYMATAAVSLVACAKQPTTTPADSQTTDQSWRKTTPEPLAERPFIVPEPVSGTLSNGIQVVMVENHEVPLVYVRLTLNVGGFMDPADRPGLASVTMDMLNEGQRTKCGRNFPRHSHNSVLHWAVVQEAMARRWP